ncbi:MAG: polysaccharide biosynthesis protein [Myxococcales bacterium]|nr:polysaccharide biosynthesis protein [Myxococcales bacterium]
MLEETLIRHRRGLIMLTHATVFTLSLLAAFAVRFDVSIPPDYIRLLQLTLPLFVGTKLLVFGLMKQFSGWWRYVSLDDLLTLAAATLLSLLILGGLVYIAGLREFPRTVFVVDAMFTATLLATLRVGIRVFRERRGTLSQQGNESAKRCLVVGTGATAENLVREVSRSRGLGIHLVGMVSPDTRYVGSRIGGLQIVGGIDDLPRLVQKLAADQVIIALEGNSGDITRRVVSLCSSNDVGYRILPPTEDLVQGRVSVSRLRDVSLQDLLGRPPVRLDDEQIAGLISGETVLVTGAGGSIGSELCRQVARFGAGRLVMLEQSENPLFHLERELTAEYPDLRLEPVVADVVDAVRLKAIFQLYEPRLVLHAAAHKHVPLMEQNPSEAIKNNIVGTWNVIQASQDAGVQTCVLISTDKAVNPTSVMGASKRMAEMLVQSQNARSRTVLAAVRFGNVLGSNGSVIPIFQQQIAAGGPVTVTHPEMRRYFMTIPEATQLVLQAGALAQGGEVFVLDMGEPVYIIDVARDLIRLSGLRPDIDIPIVFHGMRPGEKLFEELSTSQETTERTAHGRVFRCVIDPPDAERVIDAASTLRETAMEPFTPAQIRRALFETLHALESGQPIPRRIRFSDSGKIIAFVDPAQTTNPTAH